MCREFLEAIEKHSGQQSQAIFKHLAAVNVARWEDLTRANIYALKDQILETVSHSSARTYFAILKGILDRYSEENLIPCRDYREILKSKDEKPLKTYLTISELERLEKVRTKNNLEKFVLYEFLVSAFTGMRISDVGQIKEENIQNGFLSYVSQKTKIHSVIPLRNGLKEKIQWLQENPTTVTLMGYNKAIKRLCKRADITEKVTVFKAGKQLQGEKWEFISSHSGRISFCTCLANEGANIQEIRTMAGHTTSQMTERYIVPTGIKLSEKAMAFFNR